MQESIIKLPNEVQYILDTLNKNNFKGYVVGGCIRDSIIGKVPKDWDISTDADPVSVKKLFVKTIDTGLKHNTVTVVINNEPFEITSFRNKPGENSSIYNDLKLRDFTVNAIAYHPKEGFYDPFCGAVDIKNKVIKGVEDPENRFIEDPLRMLRCIRFSALLNFSIHPKTYIYIKKLNGLILNVSWERIREELNKILLSPNPLKFYMIKETGILKHIIPELDICFDIEQNHPYHVYNVGIHSLYSVACQEKEKILRWAMLLHDVGKGVCKTTDEEGVDHFYGHSEVSVFIAKTVLEKLKFDNVTINNIIPLIKHHDERIQPDFRSVRRGASRIGSEHFERLIKVQKADILAQNPEKLGDRIKKLEKVEEIFKEIEEKSQCISVKDLKINGKDLKNLGMEQGVEMGNILNKLLEDVIDDPEINIKEKLVEKAETYINEIKAKKKTNIL